MSVDMCLLIPTGIRSDPVRQRQTDGGSIPHSSGGSDWRKVGWKWTCNPFPSDHPIENRGAMSVSALHSRADTDLSSTCSAKRSPAEQADAPHVKGALGRTHTGQSISYLSSFG